jgi:hypothetical protein
MDFHFLSFILFGQFGIKNRRQSSIQNQRKLLRLVAVSNQATDQADQAIDKMAAVRRLKLGNILQRVNMCLA